MSSKINPLETAFKLGKAYRNHDKVAIKYYKSSLSLNDIKQIWQTVTLKRSLYENLRGYSLPIQALIAEINGDDGTFSYLKGGYSKDAATKLKGRAIDRVALGELNIPYEKLDQLTMELLLGVRYPPL